MYYPREHERLCNCGEWYEGDSCPACWDDNREDDLYERDRDAEFREE
jgi:hypothetical protein